MDQRVRYTRKAICDAFLQLKQHLAYEDITVAALCRAAAIGRGTFYRHYKNTAEVLDEVLEQALSEVSGPEEQFCAEHGEPGTCGYPLCQFVRKNRTYRCLFFDDALSGYLADKIYAMHKEAIQEVWGRRTRLAPEELKALVYFQLSGCLAAAKKSVNMTDEQWENTRETIDRLLKREICDT